MKTKTENIWMWLPTGANLEAGISCNRMKAGDKIADPSIWT